MSVSISYNFEFLFPLDVVAVRLFDYFADDSLCFCDSRLCGLSFDVLMCATLSVFSAAKENKHEALGWPTGAYGPSKVGMTLLAFAQARQLRSSGPEDVLLNVCCPGYIDTDMTSHKVCSVFECRYSMIF